MKKVQSVQAMNAKSGKLQRQQLPMGNKNQPQQKPSQKDPQQGQSNVKQNYEAKQTDQVQKVQIPRNVNSYSHFLQHQYITEKDIEWVLKLRNKDTELQQKLNKIPNAPFNVYYKKTAVAEKPHDVRDINSREKVDSIYHLVRHRVGPTPAKGLVEFETSLRSNFTADKKVKELERGWTAVPKKDRRDFPEFLPKIQDEIKMRKTQSTQGKFNKVTYSAFDSLQTYQKSDYTYKIDKNFQKIRHLCDNNTKYSTLIWEVGLR
eukprot:TRINITY_DN5219_c0_g1_i4.p1 TRINITY_DN5219_c0_g1~~TRINITY_DN5219_c0_g1_i4.p1  ORF type:complete len:262 (+),score=33.17 TRINITY_DN5219_c0_g1_i4:226-1011(+)